MLPLLLVVWFAFSGAIAAAFESGSAATADATAERDVRFAIGAECDLVTVEALAERHPGVRQIVLMTTEGFADTSGTVAVAARSADGAWGCQSAAASARFGRSGTRPLADRRSGDGTTPAGVFPLGRVTAWDGGEFSVFGNRPDPGALVPYRDVRPEDCWGATPNNARYQHLVRLPGCTGPDEWLTRFGDVYSHAAVIGANLDPISGDEAGETPNAAAIFLHRHSFTAGGATKATSGCVSLAYDELVEVVRLLDPRLDPHFAIGPTEWLRESG